MPEFEFKLLSRKWRAYCNKEKKYIAVQRDTEEEALQDAMDHAAQSGHETTYHVTTKRMAVSVMGTPILNP